MARVTASTKRAPAMVAGKRGAAVTNLTGVKCMPLDPVSAEVALRVGTNAPQELLQTFVDKTLDIREGDVLVVAGQDYPIRSVAEWEWLGTTYRHLVLENLKR